VAGKHVPSPRPSKVSLSTTVRHYDTAPIAITAKLTTNVLLLSDVIALVRAG
jgi:3-hydroxyisobutyrate dehydrogenase